MAELEHTDITDLIQVDDVALAQMPVADIAHVLKTFVDRGAAAHRHLVRAEAAATPQEAAAQAQMAIAGLQGNVAVVLPSTRAAADQAENE